MTVKLGRGADALGLALVKLGISLAVVAGGFRAVSDDDYARVVIAQRFARAPHLDPSGTSWLPLPFWLYGGAFRLLGGNLIVARSVAVILGVGAALLLFRAAQLLGAGRIGALVGALIAALFPWSAWLGAATVPELPTAALIVFGIATLTVSRARCRVLGALALAAACFSRYEAWPVAAAFAAFTAFDALCAREVRVAVPAVLALAPVALWLLHGVFVHGDAFFFWKRVAAYRLALGGSSPLSERLGAVPRWVFAAEPELWLGLLCAFAQVRRLERYARPIAAGAALFVFLAVGELAGGGPTHHSERAALAIWLLAALALGDAVGRGVERSVQRRWPWFLYPASVIIAGWLWRVVEPVDFTDRSGAVAAGETARRLGAPSLLIDTADYAYLAVSAGFGDPRHALAFDDQDPRHARSVDAFSSLGALRASWAAHPNAWLVVSAPHAALARAAGSVRAESAGLTLIAPTTIPP